MRCCACAGKCSHMGACRFCAAHNSAACRAETRATNAWPPSPPPVDTEPRGYVFMWPKARVEDVSAFLRWHARESGMMAKTIESVLAAADDLDLAVAEPLTGARFTRRGAE